MVRPILRPLRFGEYLLERKVLTDGQLLDALAEHWQTGARLGELLISRGYLALEEVERYAQEYQDLDVVFV